MKKLTITLLILIAFFFCRAQNFNEMQRVNYRMYKGLFLCLSAGPNFSEIMVKERGRYDTFYNGSGPLLDLKIGGAIKEDLILHATLTTNFMSGPKITSNGQTQKTSDKFMIGEDFIGGGITYYMMPSNLLFSGSIGLGNFRIEDDENDTSISSDKGFGFQLKVGKEWWISRRWGLGIALSYSKLNVTNKPETNVEEIINSDNLGICINATFN